MSKYNCRFDSIEHRMCPAFCSRACKNELIIQEIYGPNQFEKMTNEKLVYCGQRNKIVSQHVVLSEKQLLIF